MSACALHAIAITDAMPPIDLDALETLVDGDAAFAQELIDEFIRCGRTSLAAIKHAIGNQDLGAVQRTAHSLKGASASMHAALTYSLAGEMEVAAQSGSDAVLLDMADALNCELQRTIEFLARRGA